MNETTGHCLTPLALELFVLLPARSGAGPHVATCSGCQEEVAEMRRVGDEFLRHVYPRTRAAIRRASARAWSGQADELEAGTEEQIRTSDLRTRRPSAAAA